MKQIGFYCPRINNTTKDIQIINVLNGLSSKGNNTIMFNTVFDTSINNDFCILPSVGAKYFYGILFCFDIESLKIIRNFPGPSNKFFVTDNIFWQNKKAPASIWYDLLDSNTNIITLNQKTYDLYSICFKQPLINMQNEFNLKECEDVLQTI